VLKKLKTKKRKAVFVQYAENKVTLVNAGDFGGKFVVTYTRTQKVTAKRLPKRFVRLAIF